jgi:hypothetical protein
VPPEELASELEARVREATDTSRRIVRRSTIVVEASRYIKDAEPIPRCAACGNVGVGPEWLPPDALPTFVVEALKSRSVQGICPACFGAEQEGAPPVRHRALVTIHAGGQRAAVALTGALAGYAVRTHPDHVLEIDLPRPGEAAVNRLLTAVADCLRDHRLEAVHVRLTDRSYTLGGS